MVRDASPLFERKVLKQARAIRVMIFHVLEDLVFGVPFFCHPDTHGRDDGALNAFHMVMRCHGADGSPFDHFFLVMEQSACR